MSTKERFQLKKFSYHGRLSVVIIDASSELPALLPLLYLQSLSLSQSVNTIQQHMVSVCQWYNYWHKKYHEAFDEMLFEITAPGVRKLVPLNALDAALSDFTAFCSYLDSGQKPICTAEVSRAEPAIANSTRDVRLGCLTQFFLFLAKRYVSARYINIDSREQKYCLDSYRFRFQAARRESCGRLNFRRRQTFKQGSQDQVIPRERSLTSEELGAILVCSRPSTSKKVNPLNPWQQHVDQTQVAAVQIRNYLMVRILANYGLRLGELLLLRTKSLIPYASGDGYALAITTYEGSGDPRRVAPRLKNAWSERLIQLAPEDVQLWELYVDHLRGNPSPSHPFLLVNSRKNGGPLSMRASQKVFDRLYNALDEHFPSLCSVELGGKLTRLHAHMFRFTWATNTFETLVEKDGCDFEGAKDRLRQLAGWSETSPMPQKYAARYITMSANAANTRRVRAQRQFQGQSEPAQQK